MKPRRQTQPKSDEFIVEHARLALLSKEKARWIVLIYALVFLGCCGWSTVACIHKIENWEIQRLEMGFVYGVTLALLWMTLGVAGALCLGKFLRGFDNDFRTEELLVRYHDRLRDLGQLPAAPTNEKREHK
jgi:hypothetical protein